MKILVTGASGFTGRHFVSLAQVAGHQTETLTADLTDIDGIRSEVASHGELDAVVHLAGVSFVGHANSTAFYAVNAVGTSNLLEVLASNPHQVRRPCVLVASSANVYGNCERSPISEEQVVAPVNHYATSKVAMEHMALTYSSRLRIVIARPFNYTGPGQSSSFLIPKLVDHFVRKAKVVELGNLNVAREFNDVRMVCEAYLRLLAYGVEGQTYNVCTGHPYTLREVIDALEGLTRHHIEVNVNPAFVRNNEVHRLCGNVNRLISCIGPLPTFSLAETVQSMIDFQRQHSGGD